MGKFKGFKKLFSSKKATVHLDSKSKDSKDFDVKRKTSLTDSDYCSEKTSSINRELTSIPDDTSEHLTTPEQHSPASLQWRPDPTQHTPEQHSPASLQGSPEPPQHSPEQHSPAPLQRSPEPPQHTSGEHTPDQHSLELKERIPEPPQHTPDQHSPEPQISEQESPVPLERTFEPPQHGFEVDNALPSSSPSLSTTGLNSSGSPDVDSTDTSVPGINKSEELTSLQTSQLDNQSEESLSAHDNMNGTQESLRVESAPQPPPPSFSISPAQNISQPPAQKPLTPTTAKPAGTESKPWILRRQTEYGEMPTETRCYTCSNNVYSQERIGPIKKVIYHHWCLQCAVCYCQLSMKNFTTSNKDLRDRQVYCRTHQPK